MIAGVGASGGAARSTQVMSLAPMRILQIGSVSAAGDDRFGLVVTVKFKGDVEDMLGQGALKHGLVALILKPKSVAPPTGMIDEGGGTITQHVVEHAKHRGVKPNVRTIIVKARAPETTLSNTGSTNFGALRDGNQMVFFVAGTKVSGLRSIEVKAFASAPGIRSLASLAESGIPDWQEILRKNPTDFADIGVDPNGLDCAKLLALRDQLMKSRDHLDRAVAGGQEDVASIRNWIRTAETDWGFSETYRGYLLDWLAETLQDIKVLKQQIAKLDKLIDQLTELLTKCSAPTRTAMGSLINGTGGALAYSVETNTKANAFELALPQGNSVTGTSAPSGFSCADTGNVEECKNGSVGANTPVTGSFVHTATIAANCGCVQVAFSADNGNTWFVKATLKGPPSTSTGASLTLTCSATVPLYGELEYGGTLTPPVAGAEVVVTSTVPDGETLTHTLTVDPVTGHYASSFGVPYAGSYVSQAHYGNIETPTCTTVVAGG